MVARAFAPLGWLAALGVPTALGAASPAPPPCARGWELKSQEDVLELAAWMCEKLGGRLAIKAGVRDLQPLAGLREIEGSLVVDGTRELRSLDGLEALEQLGRGVSSGGLWLTHNQALESLVALRGLRALGDSLRILFNPALETLAGVENVREIGQGCMPLACSAPSLRVEDNAALQSLSALRGVRGSMPQGVALKRNPRLTSLDGLQGIRALSARLALRGNRRLESLRPLAGLRSAGSAEVEVRDNPRLLSLEGLEGLTDCSSLSVYGNAHLQSLLGLRGLSGRISQDLEIMWNQNLSNLRGLEGIRSIGGLRISSNAGLRSLVALGGIRGKVAGKITVSNNPELRSLHGLQRLAGQGLIPRGKPEKCVVVSRNAKLESVEALAGVLSGTNPAARCELQFRQWQWRPLTSFQIGDLLPRGNAGVRLDPAPRCFPKSTRDRLRRELNAITSVLPEASWDAARCKECEACGVWGGLPVPCDLGSGRCRCPLGRQGKDCASPTPRVRIVPQQRLVCSQPDTYVALECTVRIALRREGLPGTPAAGRPGLGPDRFSVYAAGGGALAMREDRGSSHHAVWENETHGSISVGIWSRQGGDPAALELRVGYLRDIQPAHFLEGTMPRPSPAPENTIFPWCVDSEDCSLTAPQRIEVLVCPVGWVSDDGAECVRCSVGRRSVNGRCESDWALLLGTAGAFAVLLAGFLLIAAQAEADGLRGIVGGLRGRRVPVHDVSREGDRVLLSTWGRHYLRMGLAKSFRVGLAETGHPGLDSPKEPFRARVVSPDQLELLDAGGDLLRSGVFNASQGFVQLPLRLTPMHTGWPVPVAFSGPALLAAGACWLLWLCAWHWDEDVEDGRDAPPWWAVWVVGAALAGSAVGLRLRRKFSAPTPLQKRRQAYDVRRSNGPPTPVARGKERAISAGKLVDLHDYFQEFVRDRDMYYVVANIVKPLTAESRLSFAEYVGPSRLTWFASHFWGNGFRHFCASIQRHAETTGDWARQSYWICSLSINQHAVAGEIGADHTDSSFFLALQSGSCRGTCMVVDEQALPLTRSWCLFELLQTIKLEREGAAGFGGLFFCASTGVLNSGRASVETSMALGRRLAALRLEDADASAQADKAMIDGLVVKDMGGFDAMNSALRSRISAALKTSKESAMRDFDLLEKALAVGGPDGARAPGQANSDGPTSGPCLAARLGSSSALRMSSSDSGPSSSSLSSSTETSGPSPTSCFA